MTLTSLVPMVYVSDMEASVAFYRDALEFRMAGSYEPEGRLCWAYLKSGEANLMLTLADEQAKPRLGGGCIYYYTTDDLAAVAERLKAKGIDATEPFVTFYGMKEVCFKDPDGNDITVGQSTDEAPTDGAERAADLREQS
jgi:predicted enzyme related to lactoylglutathione lyase